MINSLQLIVHLPLINVSTPANVMTIEGVLVPIVMFDIFESENLDLVISFGDDEVTEENGIPE
jgi:hypothetical protein